MAHKHEIRNTGKHYGVLLATCMQTCKSKKDKRVRLFDVQHYTISAPAPRPVLTEVVLADLVSFLLISTLGARSSGIRIPESHVNGADVVIVLNVRPYNATAKVQRQERSET